MANLRQFAFEKNTMFRCVTTYYLSVARTLAPIKCVSSTKSVVFKFHLFHLELKKGKLHSLKEVKLSIHIACLAPLTDKAG